MTYQLGTGWARSALLGTSLMLALSGAAWGAEAKPAQDTTQLLQRMETHWQALVREADPVKRKTLIAEHRQMMADAKADRRSESNHHMGSHGPEAMIDHHGLDDLQNTAEMHTMMLDMMQ